MCSIWLDSIPVPEDDQQADIRFETHYGVEIAVDYAQKDVPQASLEAQVIQSADLPDTLRNIWLTKHERYMQKWVYGLSQMFRSPQTPVPIINLTQCEDCGQPANGGFALAANWTAIRELGTAEADRCGAARDDMQGTGEEGSMG